MNTGLVCLLATLPCWAVPFPLGVADADGKRAYVVSENDRIYRFIQARTPGRQRPSPLDPPRGCLAPADSTPLAV